MAFRITGLPLEPFAPLLALDPAELERRGIAEMTVDEPNAFPCRITLEDAEVGEQVLLLNHAHLAGPTPYASSGPIFVRRNAAATCSSVNEIPEQQRRRLLSVRAYDDRDWIVDAEVTPGEQLATLIERFFADPRVRYLHVHNARRGCYACRIDRA
jgi:hypothetical protein